MYSYWAAVNDEAFSELARARLKAGLARTAQYDTAAASGDDDRGPADAHTVIVSDHHHQSTTQRRARVQAAG